MRRFRGNKQGFYVIHSCFGGENDELIASGSEDATIFIFHRDRETPLIELQGHGKIFKNMFFHQYSKIFEEKIVNCVHFHPTISGLLASVSDDCHVKIWRPTEDEAAENSEDEFEFDFPAANVGKIFQKLFLFVYLNIVK